MRICQHCHTHNLELDKSCHNCQRSFSISPTIPWKTAMLLGLVSTGCISAKNVGEPEYGVAMMDMDLDGDGIYESYDCDDNDSAIGEAIDWYADIDADGYGDPSDVISDCLQPDNYVDNQDDCNDQDATINPDGTEETGDDIDSNCDGDIDS
jgi:hypothetical protein